MTTRRLLSALAASALLALPAIGLAQQAYTPQVGQAGKDVIWVPTPDKLVEKMLDMASVTARDFVVDLGSGDGRTVIAAAKRGAKALGLEYNQDMVNLSLQNAEKAGMTGKAEFRQADIFQTDFSNATVVTMYLLPSLNLKLRATLLKMRPGTRLVSHAFNMGDWQPDDTQSVDGYTAHFWLVPAQIGGRWNLQTPNGAVELNLKQEFQKVEGSAGNGRTLKAVKISGDFVSITLAEANGATQELTGKVSGNSMVGNTRAGQWSAVRAAQ